MVPQEDVEQLTVQFAPAPDGSLFTVAENCADPATCTVAAEGVAEMVIAGTVIVAVADFVESATDVAVTVIIRSLGGGAAGAVYVVGEPVGVGPAEIVPQG